MIGSRVGGSVRTAGLSGRASAEQRLRQWIIQNGGYVHPSLCLVESAPCGARGVVASVRISTDELMQTPLLLIPKTLHLDNVAATAAIKRKVADRRHERVDGLEQVQVVAAALAVERSLGSGSFWLPYLEALPEFPPCPWLLPAHLCKRLLPGLIASALQQLPQEAAAESSSSRRMGSAGSGASSAKDQLREQWRQAAAEARERYEALAWETVDVCGPIKGLSGDSVLWGMGQVCSRGLGSGSSSGMVPYMDLLNHDPKARPPMLQLDEDQDDRLVMTCTNVRNGELAALEAGQELYISYGDWDSPLEAWLKFGFVPQNGSSLWGVVFFLYRYLVQFEFDPSNGTAKAACEWEAGPAEGEPEAAS